MNNARIPKKVKILIAGLGIFGLGYTSVWGLNQAASNIEHISYENDYMIVKPDGLIHQTGFVSEEDHNGNIKERVWKGKPLWIYGTKMYDDGGSFFGGKPDGIVDKIQTINKNGSIEVLLRSRDYESFKEEFEEADRIVTETKERFKPYVKKLKELYHKSSG